MSTEAGLSKLIQFAKFNHKNVSYQYFIEVLYEKLDNIFAKLENSRDKIFSHDEDAITGLIAARLEEIGFNTSEQTKQNGSVDLTVELGGHKWIAEAKIAYSNSKILEGLLQLLTRYVTRDEKAGLLIYIKKPKSIDVVKNWDGFLKNSKSLESYIAKKNPELQDDLNCIFSNVKTTSHTPMILSSRHNLVRGTEINIRHFCADLYYNPADSSGNSCKKQRKDNALNNLANLYFSHLESKNNFDTDKCIEYLERLFRD